MKSSLSYLLTILAVIFISIPAFADDSAIAKLTFGENRWIEVHYLLQVQGYSQNIYDSDAGENESDDAVWSKDCQLRRSRFILRGQVSKRISFFMETDDFKVGSQGPAQSYSTTETYNDSDDNDEFAIEDEKGLFTQDAYINYKIANELQIAVGMILLPFMHHNRQSAISLLGVDYNGVVPLTGTTNVWRDTGIEIRGLLANTTKEKKGLIDYRIGVWRGPSERDMGDPDTAGTPNDDINPYSYPRYCGRVQINLLDPETGFFYSGNYLGKREIVSFGAGLDYQNHAVRNSNNNLKAYRAWTVDATIEYGLKDDDIILALQGAYVNVKNKPTQDAASFVKIQYGYFCQAGLLFNKRIQPVGKYITWIKKDADVDPYTGKLGKNKKSYIIYGLNYYIDGHSANIKAEYQQPMKSDHKANSGEKKATLQCQIFL